MVLDLEVSPDHLRLLGGMIEELKENGRLEEEKNYMQHGSTSVFEHSIKVAFVSLCIAEQYHLQVDYSSLVRGALLHDYFLYDWHEKDASHKWHGFFHPGKALKNAKKDFRLNPVERDIILKHMFPLTLVLPRYMEGWVVCLADKYCATRETLQPYLQMKKSEKKFFVLQHY